MHTFPYLLSKIPGPNSKKYTQNLSNFENRGITYFSEKFPIFWKSASGCMLEDVDGNIFLDLNSAFGVAGIGHCHPKVVQAITEQSSRLIHGMGDVHPPETKVKFLNKLLEFMPPALPGAKKTLDKAILSCNGSDACESALKTAQIHTKKNEVICFKYAYHGLGFGALDLTYKPFFRKDFEGRLANKTYFVDYPGVNDKSNGGREASRQSLEQIKQIIVQSKNSIAAVFVEPIQGRGGIMCPPEGFLSALKSLCQENNILLVFDEIYTGFARTGELFAYQHEGVSPDLICLGKTLGGGLPLSVCLGRKEVMDSWQKSNGEAIHTSTFLGNPLACSAGLAVLQVFEETNWTSKVKELGNYLMQKLKELKSPFIAEVRGRGLMLGLELTDGKNPNTKLANHIVEEALQRGIILLNSGTHGQVLSFSPPFVIEKPQIDFAVEALQEILDEYSKSC
jgi:4-aminobutyrate aminotransferase-like enzyme